MEGKRNFQIKDLIITALMVLCSQILYRILSFLFMSPYTMLLTMPIWAIIGAIAYFLVPAKTKNPWMILLFCILTSIIGFYPPYIISCIIGGVLAMLIARIKGIENYKGLTIGYILFCVLASFGGMYVPFLFYAEQTLNAYKEMFGAEYLETLTKLVSPTITVIMLIITTLCGCIGALISKKLLKKHFEKAGMI
ncbi:MptD family putative ECF transporter S component [Treponema denticola]|uniref:MptD family putative ECF transporter S component n=1 Tax=Treponema denticola TaxID=158 RepID=UPI00210585CF|nr:MptD family putative ECF transporter S component [Treponema denticola]UTY26003.1 MptD family putative ECF transporter S component [Treponema denticola]